MLSDQVFIIAEAGVNHNGDMDIALKLIDAAVKSGADAVKFQTFKAQNLCARTAPKADYQIRNAGNQESQFEMLQRLELSRENHLDLMACCRKKNIRFMSSPFDTESLNLLFSLGLDLIKIPSGEITNAPFLEKIGSLNIPVILSTGMADMAEIKAAVLCMEKTGLIKENLALLHCCTDYPAQFDQVNLRAIPVMAQAFKGVSIGYSDHTPGIEASIAAVALGARIIEKHFTLDRQMEGPDHLASIEPDTFRGMVCAIRHIETSLGDGVKKPSPAEVKHKAIVRKSIVAAKKIKKGEIFSQFNLVIKRPGQGISPMKWHEVMGRKAAKDFEPDEYITL